MKLHIKVTFVDGSAALFSETGAYNDVLELAAKAQESLNDPNTEFTVFPLDEGRLVFVRKADIKRIEVTE